MSDTTQPKLMSQSEIESEFKNEWVLVQDPEFDINDNLLSGKVISHSTDRDEVYRIDRELRPAFAAYLFTGPTPENIAINL